MSLTDQHRSLWSEPSPSEVRRGQYIRTSEHCAALSASAKGVWARGGPSFDDRVCRHCGSAFRPRSGPQVYCGLECKRLDRISLKYGIPRAELVALLDAQDWACALCERTKAGWSRGQPLHVDHDHATGKVRGFLCGDCNTALGRFGDDPAKLRRAADYLDRSSD